MMTKAFLIPFLAALAAAASPSAQGPSPGPAGSLTTLTPYGVFAQAGAGASQGVPAGTPIGASGLSIQAFDSAFANSANASTDAGFAAATVVGAVAVAVDEDGAVFSAAPPTSAGTSNVLQPPISGPHDLLWHLPAPPGAAANAITALVAGPRLASGCLRTGVLPGLDPRPSRIGEPRDQQQWCDGVLPVTVRCPRPVVIRGAGIEVPRISRFRRRFPPCATLNQTRAQPARQPPLCTLEDTIP